MSIREEIKILLLKEKTSITALAKEMSKRSSKNYTMRSLSQKLTRETLRVDEYKLIANILGYEVIMQKLI
ncbi:MAG: hypothetical protein WC197_00725 [Candidatus Gastranaerophilaceae bacterium]